MKLTSLHIQHFRGFEDLKIEFTDSNLAVFIGTNGAGKSSVLDAVAMATYWLFEIGPVDVFMDFDDNITFLPSDVREGSKRSKIASLFHWQENQKFGLVASLSHEIFPDGPKTMVAANNALHEFNQKLKSDESEDMNFLKEFNFPIFLHQIAGQSDSTRQIENYGLTKIPQKYAYKNAFHQPQLAFADFVTWFRSEEDTENEEMRLREDFKYRAPRLETVRQAFTTFFGRLTTSEYSNLLMNREKNGHSGFSDTKSNAYLTVKKNGQKLIINQLSDGEKKLLVLVCDIARRLSLANPTLVNALEGEGIIMIDEIEQHLHPQWQREVLPALQATFPNLQFIVTTHAPQVISKVKRESIYILDDNKLVANTPHTYGRDVASILYNVFGVTERAPEIQAELNACFRMLDDEKYEEAKALLRTLTETLGEDDEEILRANTILTINE